MFVSGDFKIRENWMLLLSIVQRWLDIGFYWCLGRSKWHACVYFTFASKGTFFVCVACQNARSGSNLKARILFITIFYECLLWIMAYILQPGVLSCSSYAFPTVRSICFIKIFVQTDYTFIGSQIFYIHLVIV